MNAYDLITAKIMAQLEAGTVPWHKPWKGGSEGQPKNLLSQKEYHGINRMLLACCGNDSPYWLTYKQAESVGGHVKKGEHGVPIIKALFVDADNEAIPHGKETDKQSTFRGMKVYTVFHVGQCELPEKLTAMLSERNPAVHAPIASAEKIAAEMPNAPAITHDKAGRKFQAYYSPAEDYVQVPGLSCFEQPEHYYSILFHELGHSTGHSARVGRKGVTEATGFGTTNYSKEELIAEMTATFLCGMAGIEKPYTIETSAAYIASWLRVLKGDSRFVLEAAREAQKAADYILGKGQVKREPVPVVVAPQAPQEPSPVTPRRTPGALCRQPIRESDPLAVFLAKIGGIDPDYNRGQWREEISLIQEQGMGLPPGTINRGATLTTEELADACRDYGYITDNDVDEMFHALAKDVEAASRGDKAGRVYGYVGQETVKIDVEWQRYNEQQEEAA